MTGIYLSLQGFGMEYIDVYVGVKDIEEVVRSWEVGSYPVCMYFLS